MVFTVIASLLIVDPLLLVFFVCVYVYMCDHLDTAIEGSDYVVLTTDITFPSSGNNAMLCEDIFEVLDNDGLELDENLTVSILRVSDPSVGFSTGSLTFTILSPEGNAHCIAQTKLANLSGS